MAFKAYTVKQGDNLTNIANKFDVSISEIKNYNNIPNADYIYVGDVLKYLVLTLIQQIILYNMVTH